MEKDWKSGLRLEEYCLKAFWADSQKGDKRMEENDTFYNYLNSQNTWPRTIVKDLGKALEIDKDQSRNNKTTGRFKKSISCLKESFTWFNTEKSFLQLFPPQIYTLFI